MKYALFIVFTLLTGCSVLPISNLPAGKYKVVSYNQLGEQVSPESKVPAFQVDGYKDAHCFVNADATVIITNAETGALFAKASRLCSRVSPVIIPSSKQPVPVESLSFDGKNYALLNKNAPSLFANTYEYKDVNEKQAESETLIITNYLAVNPELTPQIYQNVQGKKLSENSALINYKLIRKGDVLYILETEKAKPLSKNSPQLSYKTSAIKVFFQSSCDGYVTIEFVKHYAADMPDVQKIMAGELDGMVTKLDTYKWEPSCKPVSGQNLAP